MIKHQAIKAIREEIKKLNMSIDLKIIQGLPYAREARRHKQLISQIKRLAPRYMTWFDKKFGFASAFFL